MPAAYIHGSGKALHSHYNTVGGEFLASHYNTLWHIWSYMVINADTGADLANGQLPIPPVYMMLKKWSGEIHEEMLSRSLSLPTKFRGGWHEAIQYFPHNAKHESDSKNRTFV